MISAGRGARSPRVLSASIRGTATAVSQHKRSCDLGHSLGRVLPAGLIATATAAANVTATGSSSKREASSMSPGAQSHGAGGTGASTGS